MTDNNAPNEVTSNISKTRPLNAHIWERQPEDFYIEPFWCSERLFAEEPFRGAIYDPACGTGRIVNSALKAGLKGYGSDLVYRGWDSTPQDFLICVALVPFTPILPRRWFT